MAEKETGSIGWRDLTVADAESVRDFYASVVGWKVNPVNMGEYQDYSMQTPGSAKDVAGICHSRGETLIYRRSG
ncbi:hypothetical protein [Neptunicella sp. SCSIO 80796]|uniref:hypothetical protein n=1 Tax=Neptunicella plasticusilytica TaxID=3117012 RepID=UPI003A4D4E68